MYFSRSLESQSFPLPSPPPLSLVWLHAPPGRGCHHCCLPNARDSHPGPPHQTPALHPLHPPEEPRQVHPLSPPAAAPSPALATLPVILTPLTVTPSLVPLLSCHYSWLAVFCRSMFSRLVPIPMCPIPVPFQCCTYLVLHANVCLFRHVHPTRLSCCRLICSHVYINNLYQWWLSD